MMIVNKGICVLAVVVLSAAGVSINLRDYTAERIAWEAGVRNEVDMVAVGVRNELDREWLQAWSTSSDSTANFKTSSTRKKNKKGSGPVIRTKKQDLPGSNTSAIKTKALPLDGSSNSEAAVSTGIPKASTTKAKPFTGSIRAVNKTKAATMSPTSNKDTPQVSKRNAVPTTTTSITREELWYNLTRNYSGRWFWKTLGSPITTFPTGRLDPIIITNKTSQDFALCTIPKNGCSRWRRFARRVEGYENDYLKLSPHYPPTNGLKYPVDFEDEDGSTKSLFRRDPTPKGKMPGIPSLPRIAFIRDPSTRLLSGWLEKVNINNMTMEEVFPNGTKCGEQHFSEARTNFTKFVDCLEQGVGDPCSFDPHFAPQTCGCSLLTMKYDLLLPVEQTDDWLMPLKQVLHLDSFMRNYSYDGSDFGSSNANQKGSKRTNATDHVCGYYDAALQKRVKALYHRDEFFSTFDVSEAC